MLAGTVKAFFSQKSGTQGFNAVEMLVVLAVIAIVAGLLVPNISKITGGTADGEQTTAETADTVKDRSNAQNIVSMWSAVAVLGGNLPGTKEDCINTLMAGTNVAFAGGTTHYQLSGMSAEDVASAGRYIGFAESGTPRLVYHPEGGQ